MRRPDTLERVRQRRLDRVWTRHRDTLESLLHAQFEAGWEALHASDAADLDAWRATRAELDRVLAEIDPELPGDVHTLEVLEGVARYVEARIETHPGATADVDGPRDEEEALEANALSYYGGQWWYATGFLARELLARHHDGWRQRVLIDGLQPAPRSLREHRAPQPAPPMHRCPDAPQPRPPMSRCPDVPMSRCPDVPMSRGPMHRSPDVRCTAVPQRRSAVVRRGKTRANHCRIVLASVGETGLGLGLVEGSSAGPSACDPVHRAWALGMVWRCSMMSMFSLVVRGSARTRSSEPLERGGASAVSARLARPLGLLLVLVACGEPPPHEIGDCSPVVEALPAADVRVLHEGVLSSASSLASYEEVAIVLESREAWLEFLAERWDGAAPGTVDFEHEQVIVLFDYSASGRGTDLYGWSAVELDGGVHVEADFAEPAEPCGGMPEWEVSLSALMLAVPEGDLSYCYLDGPCKWSLL